MNLIAMTLFEPRRVLVVTGAVFLALTCLLVLTDLVTVDTVAREALLAWATPPVVSVARVVNYAGDKLVLVPGTLLLFLVFPRARATWWVWLALMLAAPVAEGGLKELIGRSRPEGLGAAFPSGHATAAAAYFGAVIYLARDLPARVRAPVQGAALVVTVLVALARVTLRAHWPSDALAGLALGLALASTAALLASHRPRQTVD